LQHHLEAGTVEGEMSHRFNPWAVRDERANERKEYWKAYYQKHREKKIARAHARNRSNPEAYAAYMREYRKNERAKQKNNGRDRQTV
jgi:hypothetical protein